MIAPVVLITGGAQRIGRAIAMGFHQAGYRVMIHCHRSKVEAESLAHDLNHRRAGSAAWVAGDLSHTDTSRQVVQATLAFAGQLNVLINNASLFDREQNWEMLFAVNVRAPFDLSYQAYSYLSESHGCIINITDIHAQTPLKGYSVYCQSKAALWMQTKSLAKEFAPKVRVNAIAPGAMMWPEGENSLSSTQKDKIISNTPLRKHGEPTDIATAALALVQQIFVTGQTLAVDGGRSI